FWFTVLTTSPTPAQPKTVRTHIVSWCWCVNDQRLSRFVIVLVLALSGASLLEVGTLASLGFGGIGSANRLLAVDRRRSCSETCNGGKRCNPARGPRKGAHQRKFSIVQPQKPLLGEGGRV
ncbi:unnamed protein product, partial [Ectocarpus sp. 8 AP-2014]